MDLIGDMLSTQGSENVILRRKSLVLGNISQDTKIVQTFEMHIGQRSEVIESSKPLLCKPHQTVFNFN